LARSGKTDYDKTARDHWVGFHGALEASWDLHLGEI